MLIAGAAWRGLSAWKKEIGHKEKYKTLDDLFKNMDEFLYQMKLVIKEVEVVEIGIESYSTTPHRDTLCEGENNGFVHFILKRGDHYSNRLGDSLDNLPPILSEIRKLMLRSEFMGFKSFNKAKAAHIDFIQIFNKVGGLAQILAYDSDMNWEHPLIQKNLTSYSKIKSSELEDQINTDFEWFLKFYKENMEILIH